MESRKRKAHPDMEKSCERKHVKPKLKLEDAPPVHSIGNLIEIGKSIKFYRNLDTIMLWRITPYLEELEKMIGMDSLKETIFYQIIYYLQGMHTRNRNEEYLHTIVYGPPGSGKCLAKDTPIITYKGHTVPVQNIRPGDQLMGDDSSPRNVSTICRGREKMYRVEQAYGDPYTVNSSHILSLKLTKSPIIIKEKLSTKIVWFDYNGIHQTIFPSTEEEKAINDFIFSRPLKGSIIDISVRDYLQREKKWSDAYKGYKVPVNFSNKYTSISPYIYGSFIGISTISARIPDEYKYTDITSRLHLLAGILDYGGYLQDENYIVNKTDPDIVWLSRSLGFSAILEGGKIVIGGNIQIIPSKFIEGIIPVPKGRDFLVYPIKIVELPEGEYYGFTIDGNGRFLLGDFTVTHNTTVAKIVGKIYQAMNILSGSGIFKVAYRDDFVAGYLGQTAAKTKKLLNTCIGGVLFIDEVYALAPRDTDRDSFAKEAIDTITGFLSEHKNDFCCIVAGYEDEVRNCFFAMNKGLERRFPWVHRIPEYTSPELYKIFMKMVKDMGWDTAFEEKVLIHILDENKKMFKNAGGDIETFLTKCKMFHARRVFSMGKEHRFILTEDDITHALEFIKKYNTPKEDGPPSGMYT